MRIACLMASDFEDSEFRVPYDRFRAAGHEVMIIGLKSGQTLRGKHGRESIPTDQGIDDVSPEDFDALFIPGGYSPDQLRADRRMVGFVRAFQDRPIFAICHGPQLLITAGLVKDRSLTAWQTVQGDLRHAGAQVEDREVVVDDNLVTSRKPDDLDAFVRESLRVLGDRREQPSPPAA
ncbi:MAG TPA: type 1 glutamine amidotransferase domain-containing protein [Polyangia bacterium]|jgi:protease I|nr:type 1 glutamine amidotransferase domain-containing protein [Polyangia bacterium]